jgi:hypothetical protein
MKERERVARSEHKDLRKIHRLHRELKRLRNWQVGHGDIRIVNHRMCFLESALLSR